MLGTDAIPKRTGQVLPATGVGFVDRHMSTGLAALVLLALSIGFIGIAVGVGRRLT